MIRNKESIYLAGLSDQYHLLSDKWFESFPTLKRLMFVNQNFNNPSKLCKEQMLKSMTIYYFKKYAK